ncbi:MAG: hypothetical protein L0211_09415 [Planctomycetaceae bacterium]|nr:hypothetical protein [Planctomycetaceae bacterium]
MNDKATKRGGAAVAIALMAVLVLLPLLYVLSVGPFVWMAGSGWIGQSWMPVAETVYEPLNWAANDVPVIGEAIQSYAKWWEPPMPGVVPPAASVPATSAVPTPQSGR